MGIYQRKLKHYFGKISAPLFFAALFTIANIETTNMSIDGWMDKDMIQTYMQTHIYINIYDCSRFKAH